MTNILFVAFEFPPLNRGGVYRPLAFVKYLPEFGINPVVVTLDKESYGNVFDSYGYDENFGLEVREQSDIVEVKAGVVPESSDVHQFFSIYFAIHGNETKYWKDAFQDAVAAAVKKYNPQAVFATIPPFSILPLVADISKKYKLPLVLDFRDAWSQWRTAPYGTIVHYWRTLYYEGKYLRAAGAVIGTSNQTLSDFKKIHKSIPENKFHYLPNGYSGELKTWKPIDNRQTSFTIGYVGSFYYSPEAREQMLQPWWKKKAHRIFQYIPHKQDWMYRSPYFFFRALKQLNDSHPDLGRKLKVKFAGKIQSWLKEMIKSFDLESQVELMGEVSHKESLQFQEDCDALLITSAKQIGGQDYSIAGKTFEYLQMQRPIIAFVCEGAQKEILEQGGTALVCDPDDTDKSVQLLSGLFSGQIKQSPDYDFLQTLSRKELTKQLADIIRSQVHNS